MRNIFLFITLFGFFYDVYSQDLIVKKDSSIINAKVIEIGVESIRFKKNENLDGPDYVLPKKEIEYVKLENGTIEIVNEEIVKEKIREGTHFGFHFTPGIGKFNSSSPAYEYGFSYNSGFDVSFYFNNFLGLKTGVNYKSINWYYSGDNNNISAIGLPLKFIGTSGKKIGIHFEFGFCLYKVHTTKVINYSSINPFILNHELLVGVNYKFSSLLSFNIGVNRDVSLSNYSKYYSYYQSKTTMYGVQAGILFYLSK